MPRYLLDLSSASGSAGDDAVRLAARRFPEIAVERRYAVDAGEPRELWVCRAPSEQHVHRWAVAAGLGIDGLRRIASEVADLPGTDGV